MTEPLRTANSAASAPDAPGLLWTTAAAVAAFGDWMFFDAQPGINWLLWTAAATAGLLLFTRRRGLASRGVLLLGALPVIIAGAAAVTANPPIWVLICLSVMVLLAIQMLLATSTSLRALTTLFAVFAPPLAFKAAVFQSARRAIDATNRIRSTRARAWVRGLAITLPGRIGFALLLSQADPTFAGWRDAIGALFADWEFVPRIIFFIILLVAVLGAYGHAASEPGGAPAVGGAPVRWLGSTERMLLLGSVAALLWLFLLLQLGYFFGNLPRIATSGVTFAEYARRGFGELSVVASASALLIIGSERYGSDDGRRRTLRLVTLAVIAAVLLLLGSAFRRVLLYEAAYGWTTARLYAQVYMTAVAAGLVVLWVEVAGEFDAGRLFRRATAAAAILFVALIYWNHEAWIARQNIDRFAVTAKLDVAYLATELSEDAIPAMAERLPSLPDSVQRELRKAVLERDAKRRERPRAWFEWNLASSRARRVLDAGFGAP